MIRSRATSCCAATARGRCSPPGELFLTAEEFFIAARAFARADIRWATALAQGDMRTDIATSALPVPEVAVERRAADPLHRLKAFLSGGIARACCSSPNRPGGARR